MWTVNTRRNSVLVVIEMPVHFVRPSGRTLFCTLVAQVRDTKGALRVHVEDVGKLLGLIRNRYAAECVNDRTTPLLTVKPGKCFYAELWIAAKLVELVSIAVIGLWRALGLLGLGLRRLRLPTLLVTFFVTPRKTCWFRVDGGSARFSPLRNPQCQGQAFLLSRITQKA